MCIKCDQMALKSLVHAVANHHKKVDERRAAEVNRVLDNVGEQAQEERVLHTQVVEQLNARLNEANARANEAEMLALANRRWSERLNEQLRQVKQDREQMHTEHENLMSAYKALLESQRLLILSLE